MDSIGREIRSLIDLIQPMDRTELQHATFIEQWIDLNAKLFRGRSPSTSNPPLVTYFLGIDPYTKNILLRDLKKPNLWLRTGGHTKLNEHPQESVRRGVHRKFRIETTFLSEHPLFITVTNAQGPSSYIDITLGYILKGCASNHCNFDQDEFPKIQWFPPSAIPYDRSEPQLKRCLGKINDHFSLKAPPI